MKRFFLGSAIGTMILALLSEWNGYDLNGLILFVVASFDFGVFAILIQLEKLKK